MPKKSAVLRQKQKTTGTRVHLIAIAVLAFLTYSTAIAGGFVWDDELQIVKNPQIRDLRHIPSAFTSAFWAFADPDAGSRTNFYRPVQTLSYTVAYQISGLAPWPYHLINVLFHVLASVLVYLICVELDITATAALIAAAIFAVHPIHSETIAWSAGTPDASCGAFYFASILFFLKFMKSGENKWQWFSAIAFVAACFSKEMAVTLPVVIALLMYKQGRFKSAQLSKPIRDIAPLIAAGAVYLVVRFAALGFISTTHLDIQASAIDWLTLGVRVFGQYIRYSLLPYPLTAYHLIPLHLSDRVLPTLLYTLLIAAGIAFAITLDRRVDGVALWSLIFALMLVPVFNFKGISLTFFAERYLYIPTLAISVIIGLLLNSTTKNVKMAMSVVVAVFAIFTVVRIRDWSSDENLYVSTLRVQPEVAHILNNLADIYIKRGDDTGARKNLEAALLSLNDKAYVQAENEKYRALVGLGAVEARARQYPEAKEHFKQALDINPRGDWAYLYMGGVLMESDGNIQQAMEFFKKAIDLGPVNEVARDYMGIALFNLKRNEEAARYFHEALAINPTYKDAQKHLDMATQTLGSNQNDVRH